MNEDLKRKIVACLMQIMLGITVNVISDIIIHWLFA